MLELMLCQGLTKKFQERIKKAFGCLLMSQIFENR